MKSGIFDMLHSRVESIEVFAVLLKESVAQKRHLTDPERHYQLVLNFLWYCAEHPNALLHYHTEDSRGYGTILQHIFQDVDKQDRSIIFVSLWFMLRLPEHPDLRTQIGNALLEIESDDILLNEVIAVYLSELMKNTRVRSYFRDIYLQRFHHPRFYAFLADHHHKRDLIQQLYGISGVQ